MESLLANYASSDEEEGPQPSRPPSSSFSSTACSLFSSLPEPGQQSSNPTSPSFLSSLSPPDLAPLIDGKPTEGENCAKPISLFSRLPQPQFRQSSSSLPKSKNIIQFKPHIPSALPNNSDNEDEDEGQEDKDRRCPNQDHLFGQAASVKSFLSSIPAPKKSATLGVGASSGSARRSTIEAQVSASSSSSFGVEYPAYNQNAVNHGNYELSADQNAVSSVNYTGYGNLEWTVHQNYGEYANIATNENCELGGDQCCDVSGYGDYYKQYESNWSDGSASVVPQSTGMCEVARKVPGKRGRNELPVEILEVKQDELMKNRPREDQVKLTGIAFGPAYQPASTKGKPSKLHKRKHQIGSLYYDMRQKETELAERRARGFLTKAQTQAKYGW